MNTEEDRCREHHPESWWPGNKRCDKAQGHKGKHVFQTQTMFGPDPSEHTFWDENGSATYVDKKARREFLRRIDEQEAAFRGRQSCVTFFTS